MPQAPPRSIRVRLLAAVLVPAVLLIVGTFFAFGSLEASHARHNDAVRARLVAVLLATAVKDGGPYGIDYPAYQRLLGTSSLLVEQGGRVLYRSPPPAPTRGDLTTARFPGGLVTILTDVDGNTTLTLELTAVAAAALILVVLVGLVLSSLVMDAITEPITQAAEVADRLAGGDLSARMGPAATRPFESLARAFDGMAERIESADTLQEQFLSDLAHEIATPVNSVAGLARAALDHTIEAPEDLATAQQLLDEEVARLEKLLADLRALRMPTLSLQPEWQWFDAGGLVDALGRRFAAEAEAAQLRLSVRSFHLELISDPELVERVVSNFLTNAIRYTPAGGSVTLSLRRANDLVVFAVSDTGVGLSEEDRARIFDRFYRADRSRDRASGGTGLGLAIARRAATALGARIEVDSTLGSGSEFRLLVPTAPPPPATGPEESDDEEAGGGADDEPGRPTGPER